MRTGPPKSTKVEVPTTGFHEEEDDYMFRFYEIIEEFKAVGNDSSSFATAGELVSVPRVYVAEDVGRIGYPLCSQQATALLKVATQAPFGKGKKTVVDTNVRQAWQISSDLVKIDPQWLNSSLPALVADCCKQLGINAKMNVRAELYKMLLYEKGGHFKKHKDTERCKGMFGSLLIQLPAEHEGGHLRVQHAGSGLEFKHDKDSADKAYYAAFYADCDHELQPVTSGLRLVLAFNLIQDASRRGITASASSMTSSRNYFDQSLAAAAKAWCADEGADLKSQTKFALPLEHKYTETNMSFAGMKGKDAKVLSLLENATDPSTGKKLFNVYLARVQKHLTGSSNEEDYDYDYYGGRGGYSSMARGGTDYDVEGVTEDMFGDEPDSREVEGYQGNYAGSCEYWYDSAVLVFWPTEKDFDVTLALGISQAIAALQALDRTHVDFGINLAKFLSRLHEKKQWTQSLWDRGLILPYSDDTWRLYDPPYILRNVLPLTLNLEQVKKVLAFGIWSSSLSNAETRHEVAAQVSKYGMPAFQEELVEVIEAQNSQRDVMELLRLLDPRASLCVKGGKEKQVWNGLVNCMASAVLNSEKFKLTADEMIEISDFLVKNLNDVKVLVQTAKKILTLTCECTQKLDTKSAVKLVFDQVSKHGFDALHVELEALLAEKSLDYGLDLLSALKSCAQKGAVWSNLVKSFAARVLQSDLYSIPAAEVSRFIIENCDAETQVSVAEFYGRNAWLSYLNRVILTLRDAANGATTPFQEKLLTFTESILRKSCNTVPAVLSSDVATMVEWVFADKHFELLTRLLPQLTQLCSSPSPHIFDAIFEIPAVMAEMNSEPPSAPRAQLESLVHARIEVLAKLKVVPEFTWCQPGALPGHLQWTPRNNYQENWELKRCLDNFFASEKSVGVIKGAFSGIQEARDVAKKIKQENLGNCEVSGVGKKSQVVISKNRSIYIATQKECALRAEEYVKLCQMLGLPHGEASSSSAGAKRKIDVGKENQPAVKKVINLC
eukprot:GSChrysophyteH1.ASY1.ANO1.321.1 assembled CDS